MVQEDIESVVSVQVWQPAVRTVVLYVWADDTGKVRHEIEPVLAMETRVVRVVDSTETWERVEYRPVVPNFDGSIGSPDSFSDREFLDYFPGTHFRVAACPWPPEEDEERLAPQLSFMTERVERRLAYERTKK